MADQKETVTIEGRDRLSQTFEGIVAAAKELERSAQQVGAAWDESANRFRSVTTGKFISTVDIAKNAVGELKNEVKGSGDWFDEASGRWRNASGQFIGAAERAQKGLHNLNEKGKTVATESESWMGKIATGAAYRIGGAIVEAVGRGIEALKNLGVEGFNLAKDFEKGGFKLQALGVPTDQLDALNQKAKDFGYNSKFGAIEAQDAMANLIKMGLNPAEKGLYGIDAVLKDVIDLATAEDVSLDFGVQLVGNQLQVWATDLDKYNGTALTSKQITDSVGRAASASALDVTDFEVALGQAAAPGKVLGMTLDEINAAIAFTRKNAGSASDAGTALKNMFINISPRTKRAKELMQDYGIISLDTAKATEYLRAHGLKKIPTDLNGIYTELFKTGQATKAFSGTGEKAFENYEKWLIKAGLSQNRFFDSAGNFKGLSNFGNILQEKLGGLSAEELTPILTEIFGDGAKVVEAFVTGGGAAFDKFVQAANEQFTVTEKAAIMSQGMSFELELLKKRIGGAAQSIVEAFLPQMGGLTKMLNEGALSAIKFGEGFKAAPDKMAYLRDEMPGLMSVFDGAVERLAPLGEAFGRLGERIASSFAPYMPVIKSSIVSMWEAAGPIFDSFINVLVRLLDWIGTNMPLIAAGVAVHFATLRYQAELVMKSWGTFASFVDGVWNAIWLALSTGAGNIMRVLGTLDAAFTGDWKRMWDNVYRIITSWWDVARGWFNLLPANLQQIGINMMNGLIAGIRSLANTVYEVLKSEVFGNALTQIKQFLGIKSPSRVYGEIGQYMMEGLAMGISGSAGIAVGQAVIAARKVTSAFVNAVSTPSQTNRVKDDWATEHLPPATTMPTPEVPPIPVVETDIEEIRLNRIYEPFELPENYFDQYQIIKKTMTVGEYMMIGLAKGISGSAGLAVGEAVAAAQKINETFVRVLLPEVASSIPSVKDDWATAHLPTPPPPPPPPPGVDSDIEQRRAERESQIINMQVDNRTIASATLNTGGNVVKSSARRVGL